MNSTYELFPGELALFLDFLKQNTITRVIIEDLEHLLTTVDLSEYHLGGRKSNSSDPYPNFPKHEKTKVVFLYKNLIKVTEIQQDMRLYQRFIIGTIFADTTTNSNLYIVGTEGFKKEVFLPFFRYILENIKDGDFLLYLLIRYKVQVEWFERDRVFNIYYKDQKESDLDHEVRKFLFAEGLDCPFSSEPKSPSGKADILVYMPENYIPLDVKIFDPPEYGNPRIRDGFNQASRYAHDYNSAVGYLIIFNPSKTYLHFESDTIPPSFLVGGKKIFGVIIDICPSRPSASKESAPKRNIIDQRYLENHS